MNESKNLGVPINTASIPQDADRLRQLQWRMLLATMFCYFFFYTGRQTFGFAIPGIKEELGLSNSELGWISAVMLWTYALGQFINGNLGDKYGGRRIMSLGAILSCGLNWVVSFGTGIASLAIPWAINGYAQSMGWAPGSRVLSNWWAHAERGIVYGAYVFAAGMASVLAFATSILILELEMDWRWIFRLPVLLMVIGGVAYYIFIRDRPEDLGFSIVTDNKEEVELSEISGQLVETSWSRYRHVLTNPEFMIASLAIGFQSVARYGLIIWVPVHFLGSDWKDSPDKWVSLALPIGMALGAMANGWISDRFLNSNRSRGIFTFLALASICSAVMYFLPTSHPLVLPLLFLTGFFVYGPQSSFWALCPDILGQKRAGTGTGVMNTFAYAFAGLGEPLIGWLVDRNGDTGVIFATVSIACILGAVITLFIRR